MNRINSRVLLPGVTGLLGVLWVAVGLFKYGWWGNGKPTSGFFPTIVGALLLVLSILAIISELKEEPPTFLASHLHPLIAAVGMVLAALLLGFFPALTIYVFSWLKWYEKYSVKFSLITTVATVGAMYGIFSLWLRVPFPAGAIIDWIMR